MGLSLSSDSSSSLPGLSSGALGEGVGFLRAVLRLARHVVSKELRWLMCTEGGGLRRAVEATTAINVEGHHPLPFSLR